MTRSISEISRRARDRDLEQLKTYIPSCVLLQTTVANNGSVTVDFEFRWVTADRHHRHMVSLKEYEINDMRERMNCSIVAACVCLLRDIALIAHLIRPFEQDIWKTPQTAGHQPKSRSRPPYVPKRRIRTRPKV